jgi:hypothetical protein
MPDDELTPREVWNPEEVDELDELELLAVWVVDKVPGIVDALTTASTPTPAKALIATPAVRRFSVCIAASRACTLACLALVSMVRIVGGGSEARLRAS